MLDNKGKIVGKHYTISIYSPSLEGVVEKGIVVESSIRHFEVLSATDIAYRNQAQATALGRGCLVVGWYC